MDNEPSLKKNYVYHISYEILKILTPFITTPYVSRVLGADSIGIYSYTSTYATYFSLFAALGTSSYGMREIARYRNDRKKTSQLFWEIELMTVITSSICIVLWILMSIMSTRYRICFFALTPMIFSTMFDINWYYIGYEKVKYTVIRNTICKLTGIVMLFCFVKDKNDLILYIVINSMIQMLGSLSMWTYLPSMLVKIDCKELKFKEHFRNTLIYFVPTIATSIYTVLDKTLIGIITNNNYENGYYEQASKIINISKSVVFTSVNAVMGARISYLFALKKIDEIKKKIDKSIDFIMLLGFLAATGIICVSKAFVPLFFGKGYKPVIELMCIMAPIIIIIGISNCLGSLYYSPSGRRAQSSKYIIAGAVANLILNITFIPKFGAIGAVIASLIAEGLITVLYLKNSNGYMKLTYLLNVCSKKVIASICMLIYSWFIYYNFRISDIMYLVIISGGVVIIYFGLLIVMRDNIVYILIDYVKNIKTIKLKKYQTGK